MDGFFPAIGQEYLVAFSVRPYFVSDTSLTHYGVGPDGSIAESPDIAFRHGTFAPLS